MTAQTAHHVGITVSDLDHVVDFYQTVFDASVIAKFSVSGEAFETGVGIEDASARFAHLDLGSIRLEIVTYEPEQASRPKPTLNQPGAAHLGIRVDDLDAFYASLPESITTLSEPQTTETGTRICFLRDPEANLVEVLELS